MIRRSLAYIGVVALASTVAVAAAPAAAHADEIRDSQWYLETLGINDAHELSQGEGVTIGVIDSGIDATHPDLENNVEAGKDYGISKDEGLNDARDHGTAVASVLAGHGHDDNNQSGILGVAPKATVVSVGVDWENRGDPVGNWICDAVAWLTEQEVDVISTSIGAASCANHRVVEEAAEQGIPVVASAGNTKQEFEGIEYEQDSGTGWPATLPHAIPVSGTAKDGAFWAGSLTLEGAAPQPQFGLSAPAANIPIAMPNDEYQVHDGGTSLSAPIVAGTLALIKSAYPDLSYELWMERLLETVDDKGDEGYDDKYGWGIVNPHKALTEEVAFEGLDSSETSSPDDRLPLEEQGTNSGDSGTEGDEEEGAADSNPLAAATNGFPAWLIIAIVAGLLLVTAAIITAVVLAHRRKKNKAFNNPPLGGTPGPGAPPPGTSPPGSGAPDGSGNVDQPLNAMGHPNAPNRPQDWQHSAQAQPQAPQPNPPGNTPPDPNAPFSPPQ